MVFVFILFYFYEILMKESRDRIYGRLLASQLNQNVLSYVNIQRREWWKDTFLLTLQMYSFRPRKETEPVHEGCKYWLESIDCLDFRDPGDYALFVMGDLDQMFQKDRARRVYLSFLENF